MSKLKSALEGVPKVFRYLMVLGVVILISLLFPGNVRFKYEFEEGQSWKYETLEAPFDYALQKPQAQIDQEMSAALQDFHPYYEFKTGKKAENLNGFEKAFDLKLNQISGNNRFEDVKRAPNKYRGFGLQLLADFYDRGIIQVADIHQDQRDNLVINVLRSVELEQRRLGDFPTVTKVRQLINDILSQNSNLENADFLYPILQSNLEPNVVYNDSISAAVEAEIRSSISPTAGMVTKGELIVTRGGKITPEAYQKLISLQNQYEKTVMANRSRLYIFVGYFILTSLIIIVFLLYLINFAPGIFNSTVKMIFIFMWLVLYSYLVTAVEATEILSAYLVPFCIIPIVIKTFYDARLALFTHIVVVLIASFLSSQGYEFTFLQILAGIVVLLTNVDTRDWTRFFYAILYILLTYVIGYFGLALIQGNQINNIDLSAYSWIFLNVLLTLLAYPLIPLLERFFGFTSSISLLELSDMNRPLLRKLSLEAPGTWQHSLQVANLSEAAAQSIGANPLLVKVAALYHDIGKTKDPQYFIENQSGQNPHDGLDYLKSARIIIGHVPAGVEMAKKARLPKLITNFIRTHHGTTRVEYFYRNYTNDHPNELVDEKQFRYPGPLPTSKEETILMLADSIEAACKSLKNPSEGDLSELIDKIIAGKIKSGQLDHSEISFQELEKCRQVFRSVMRSVHHVRIEYPEEKKEKAE